MVQSRSDLSHMASTVMIRFGEKYTGKITSRPFVHQDSPSRIARLTCKANTFSR
jgi:hypothetical protein